MIDTLGHSADVLQAFFGDFLGGKLTPHLKSEEIPAENNGLPPSLPLLRISPCSRGRQGRRWQELQGHCSGLV
jgi:hypothetical protein